MWTSLDPRSVCNPGCVSQATIKKTLSNFRRTHHDTWRDHKVMFTDDQLAVITDLLVSPSYYA